MRFSFKKTIVVTLALLSFLGASVLAFTPILKLPVKSVNNWMSKVDDSAALSSLTIPGSHDSMARTAMGGLSGECQYLDLDSQLNAGIRFLDIRLENKEKDLRAVHGFIDQGTNFSSIERTIETFLKNNPSEGLIVSIKDENRKNPSQFQPVLVPYLNPTYWLLGNTLPSTLGEIRGKVVLLSRFENSTIGVPCYSGWADGGFSNAKCFFSLPSEIAVQDHYKVKSAQDKINDIKDALEYSYTSENLTLNFASAYLDNHFPPLNAQSVATFVNREIPTLVTKYHSGVVIMDFVTEALSKHLYSLNEGATL